MNSREKRLIVAITGASGSIYAAAFLKAIRGVYDRIYLTATQSACLVMKNELGVSFEGSVPDASLLLGEDGPNIEAYSPDDLSAPPSSGSVQTDGMVIIPCTMGTAGRIASGVSTDLVTRAADVCLKERRKLILVVRETPLNLIHLRNLTALTEAGAVILPASPAFYHNPQSIDDMVSFVVARVMQQLGVEQSLVAEWERPSE